jgi:hypothetical protein
MKTAEMKQKVRHELVEYGLNVAYLTLVFAAFTIYRRVVLGAYGITYGHYWVALIEALVLGKVIMLGDVFRLGRGLEAKPLIYPTLYRTVVFAVLVAAFKIVEFGIKGLWNGQGLAGGLEALFQKWSDELLANSLVVFAALIPFFAVKELARVLGEERIRTLFFKSSVET